jgi:5-oxoprolinase (ATP-hydrolysing) subunit C
MGLRLEGPPLPSGSEILSHPVVPGSIQVPGDGHPLVLLVDGPTIGGYPVAGVVSRAELPRLGQLRPGERLQLAPQDVDEARSAWRAQQRLLSTVADTLRADAVWHRLPDNAGA